MAVSCSCTRIGGGGLEEQRREERPISVEAHGKSWLEHDLTTVKLGSTIARIKRHMSVVCLARVEKHSFVSVWSFKRCSSLTM